MPTKSLRQLSAAVRFEFRDGARRPFDKRDEWQQTARDYRCRFTYQGRTFAFDFYQGPAITTPPRKADCLDSLLSDAQAGQQSFDEFCSDMGYDTDSRSARRTWKVCQKIAAGMQNLLGGDFETFLYADRN